LRFELFLYRALAMSCPELEEEQERVPHRS
jgi:hypothetical protein